jgi:hypothetical protein
MDGCFVNGIWGQGEISLCLSWQPARITWDLCKDGPPRQAHAAHACSLEDSTSSIEEATGTALPSSHEPRQHTSR